MKKPLILMILDGFGIAPEYGNAIMAAKKPNLDRLFRENPLTQIGASGLNVGLPNGQMGNSEVGHTNIGAGRIVYQELTRITKEIEDGDFYKNPALIKAVAAAKAKGTALHLIGLLSDGGVHQPQWPSVRAAGAGKAERPFEGLCSRTAGRPRRSPFLRQRLC